MAIPDSDNRHAEHNRKAMEALKVLATSLDGFDFSSVKGGVTLYTKSSTESPVNIVRGDKVFETTEFTPREIAALVVQSGTRATWDEKFDQFELLEILAHEEYLWWIKFKSPWPVSPRDFVGTLLMDHTENESFVCMSSVKDSAHPERPHSVRGTLLISGWRFFKTNSGIGITYVTQVDLAGSIPTSILKSINIQIALCAGTVADYAATYGFPPFILSSSSRHKGDRFDHSKRQYEVGMDGGECQISVSKKMYPNGIKLTVSDNAQYEMLKDGRDNYLIVVKSPEGAANVSIGDAINGKN